MSILKILITTVAVLILVASAIIYFVDNESIDDVKKDLTKPAMGHISQSLQKFLTHNGGYPYTEEGFAALLTKPDQDDNWKGPYIEANRLADPWGTAFSYESNGITFRIASAAEDRKFGTEDDITYK